MNNKCVVFNSRMVTCHAIGRILVKSYMGQVVPVFFTPKSYPVLAGVNHLIPADCQVVPVSILTICSANWYPCKLVPSQFSFLLDLM